MRIRSIRSLCRPSTTFPAALAAGLAVLAAAAGMEGCSSSSGGPGDGGLPDTGTPGDSGTDTGAGMDSGRDSGTDSATDSGSEAGPVCLDASANTWDTPPKRIDSVMAGMSTATFPHVGIDTAGNAFAVWEQQDAASSTFSVWASNKPAGGAWTAPVSLSLATAPSLADSAPQVAVSASGTAIAVWQQQLDTDGGVGLQVPWVSVYASGMGWSAAQQLDAPTADAVSNPQIAIDPMGNAVAVWTDGAVGGFFWIMGSHRPAGGAWSTPVIISAHPDGGVGQGQDGLPDVAVDTHGNAMAVWTGNGAGGFTVSAARFDATAGAWSTWALLGQCATCGISSVPRVAIDDASNAYAVWTWDSMPNGKPMFAANYTASSSTWGSPVQLDATLPTNLDAANPRVATNGAGAAVAVWENTSNDAAHPNVIYASRYASGAWTPATFLDTPTFGGSNPEVAVDDTGDAIAVWSAGVIQSSFFAAGGSAWTPEQAASMGTMGAMPVVAFTHGCPIALALWQDGVASNTDGVFGSYYR